MVTHQEILQFVDKIVKVYDPEKVILFGSYANDTATDDSDVDLCIIKEDDRPYVEKYRYLSEALGWRPFPTDLIILSQSEINSGMFLFDFENEVIRNGKLLFNSQLLDIES